MPPTISSDSKNRSIYLIVAVFAMLLIVVFVMQGQFKIGEKKIEEVKTKENVVVQKIDLTKVQGDSKLPSQFTKDISVDLNTITESYSATFPDRGVTQNTIVFESSKSMKTLFQEYLAQMTKAGYVFGDKDKDENLGYLSGNKDRNNLTIVIASVGGKSQVHATYLVR